MDEDEDDAGHDIGSMWCRLRFLLPRTLRIIVMLLLLFIYGMYMYVYVLHSVVLTMSSACAWPYGLN